MACNLIFGNVRNELFRGGSCECLHRGNVFDRQLLYFRMDPQMIPTEEADTLCFLRCFIINLTQPFCARIVSYSAVPFEFSVRIA